jgi:ABC-type lipoprotein release transport system permease subunit
MVGTALGMVLGVVLAYAEGAGRFGGEVRALLTPLELARLMAVTFVAGVALTVVGALYPAWRAAKMEPVDAMRSEV